jgi:PBP1b-binding outer membrane lipoprotein LpoB
MNTKKAITAFVLTAVILSGCGSNQAAPSAANQATANSAAGQAGATTDQPKQQQGAAGTAEAGTTRIGAAANPNQRVMMMTFQSLIEMDKASGLAITKEQAATMLPLVQDGITKNELSTDAQTNLIAPLTADQKKFIEEAAAKAKERTSGQGGQRPQGSQAGGTNGGSGVGTGSDTGQAAPGGTGGSTSQTAPNNQATPTPGGTGGAQGGQRPQGAQGQGGQRPQGDASSQGSSRPQAGQGQNDQGSQGAPQRPAGEQGGGPGVNSGQQLVELLQSKAK